MYAYDVRYTYNVSLSSPATISGGDRDLSASRTEQEPPTAPEPGTGPACRGRPRGRERLCVPDDAQAREGARRRGDVALQPRRQQGRPARRHDRHRLQRDRSPLDGGRLEGGPAHTGGLDARRPHTAPLGDRPDGGADEPRTGEPQAPQCGSRVPARSRLLGRDGRPRVLRPGRLHLRVRPPGEGHVVRERDRLRGGGAAPDARVRGPAGRLPAPRRGGRRLRREGRVRLRHRVRVRAGPDPGWPRRAQPRESDTPYDLTLRPLPARPGSCSVTHANVDRTPRIAAESGP